MMEYITEHESEVDCGLSSMIVVDSIRDETPKAVAEHEFYVYRDAVLQFLLTNENLQKASEMDLVVAFVEIIYIKKYEIDEDFNWALVYFFVNLVDEARQKYAAFSNCLDKILNDLDNIDVANQLQQMDRDVNHHISLILDHVEINSSSSIDWADLSKQLGIVKPNDLAHLKEVFDRFCKTTTFKQHYYSQSASQQKTTMLTQLEQRALQLVEHHETADQDVDNIALLCRVCLQNGDELQHLFSDCDEADALLSIASRINQCADIAVIKLDDGFPQYICASCHRMLELASHFRQLCQRSDAAMRTTNDGKVQDESEYLVDYVDNVFDENVSLIGEEVDPSSLIDLEHDDDHPEIQSSCSADAQPQTAVSSDPDAILQCVVCNKIFVSSDLLENHKKSHLHSRPFACLYCPKMYRTRNEVLRHSENHTTKRRYNCKKCDKTFTTRNGLVRHGRFHGDVLPQFTCPHCPFRTHCNFSIRYHQRMHAGLRPYACAQCPSKFVSSSNLSKHVRSLHNKEKTHMCHECGRSFFSRQCARKHMLSHTDQKLYRCDSCPEPVSYHTYSGFTKHMHKVHAGVRIPSEKYFSESIWPSLSF